MIICAPDMTPEIAAKFGVEPCQLITLSIKPPRRRGIDVLVDVGLRAAKEGADLWRYADLIAEVRPRWAICPDAFGNFEKTLELWRRWSPLLSRLTRPIFVLQEFYRVNMTHTPSDHVALPMRRHHDVNCALRPRLCAERAERALRWLCGAVSHVHLLGPPLRAVRMLRDVLRQCERQGALVSFDTSAYRRAPNALIKKRLGGRWQPNSAEEAEEMLEAWLRQALL
jgi:hypothetical protein